MRTLDFRIEAHRRNRFDIFGVFEKVVTLDTLEQKAAVEKFLEDHPSLQYVSHRMDGPDLVLRAKEK